MPFSSRWPDSVLDFVTVVTSNSQQKKCNNKGHAKPKLTGHELYHTKASIGWVN